MKGAGRGLYNAVGNLCLQSAGHEHMQTKGSILMAAHEAGDLGDILEVTSEEIKYVKQEVKIAAVPWGTGLSHPPLLKA